MPKTRSHRTRRTRSQWAEILERFASSQLGPREFCRREDLSLSSFQRWRRQLGSVAAAEFVELVRTPSPSVPLSSWSLDVSLPNGVRLQFQG